MTKKVRIINPQSGASNRTSFDSAKRMVHRGRAVWVSADSIRLQAQCGPLAHRPTVPVDAKEFSGRTYDHINRELTLDELQAIPIVQAWRMMVKTTKTSR